MLNDFVRKYAFKNEICKDIVKIKILCHYKEICSKTQNVLKYA